MRLPLCARTGYTATEPSLAACTHGAGSRHPSYSFMFPPVMLILGILWLAATAWVRRREARAGRASSLSADILAGGLLYLLIVGFFWRTLSGDVYQPADGGDLLSFLFPTYRFAAGELAQGRLPLWNPALYGGAPLFADVQAGYLYLPNLILFLVRPDFPYVTLQWMAVLHLWWAALGMYVLLRTLRLGTHQLARGAAFFGALAFGLSDPLLIHLGNLNLIAVLSWMPWVLAAFERALRAPDAPHGQPDGSRSWLRWAALAGLLLAMGTYAGHAQSTLYVGLALALYLLFTLLVQWHTPSRNRRVAQGIGALAITGLLAALLAAPLLLPAIQHTPFTARGTFTYQDTVGYSLAPAQMIGALAPGFFGRGPALHWGLWQRVELPYAGLAALMLAAAALLLTREPRARRDLLPWVGIALVGLAVGLGIYALAHGWLTQLLPFFGQLRAPARALVLWTLGLSVCAAVGVDALMRGAAAPSAARDTAALTAWQTLLRAGAAGWLGIALPLLFLSLLLTQGDETVFLRASVAGIALALAAGVWLGVWLLSEGARNGWYGPQALAALLAALLFFELSANGAYMDISPSNPTVGYDHADIFAFLRADPDRFRIDTRTDIEALWQPNTAALIGLEDVGGIANPLTLSSWDAFWESTAGRDSDRYNLLNVKYVIARDGTPLPANFALALDAQGELSVFRNAAWQPRAFLAMAQGDLMLPDPAQPPVVIDDYAPTQMRMRTDALAPALLVLSENWYPGWRATVNGAPQVVQVVNDIQRAVPVPAGEATVEFAFAPASLRWGWIAAAAGLVLLAVIFGAAYTGRHDRG